MSYQWDNKKPTAQMLGRWQPFHDGHYALFEEIIKKTGQVCIQIRDVQGVDDNPFDDSLVYSYGHRNPKGMSWDSSGNFYLTEIGPTKNDEINLITAGKNYGWPDVQCYSKNTEFVNPLKCFDPSLEPGGIIFYTGDKLGLENFMILASQKASNLYKVEVDENGVNLEGSILSGVGRIRDVAQGPDGYLYVITSNTDGKAFPSDDDDKLLRILK